MAILVPPTELSDQNLIQNHSRTYTYMRREEARHAERMAELQARADAYRAEAERRGLEVAR